MMNNFYYGLSLLNTLYGINLDEDEYSEIALVGFNLIGNKRTILKRLVVDLDACNHEVELPCDLEDLEAVTLGHVEEWAHSTNDSPNGNFDSVVIEHYIENRKEFRHPMYLPGKFVKYEIRGNKLYFDRPHGTIFILYKALDLDENELPRITDKEARALATYCAWITKYKEAMMSNNAQALLFATSLQQLWITQCDLARVDHYMSLNEWDLVLDVRTTHARKQYNKSLKVYQ